MTLTTLFRWEVWVEVFPLLRMRPEGVSHSSLVLLHKKNVIKKDVINFKVACAVLAISSFPVNEATIQVLLMPYRGYKKYRIWAASKIFLLWITFRISCCTLIMLLV